MTIYRSEVSKLVDHYPHISIGKKIEYKFLPSKPSYWVDLNQISSQVKWAIILSEDWAFYQHDGVDYQQLSLVLKQFIRGYKTRGASTISQQLVKNLFLTKERSLYRKIQEMILTLFMEKKIDKKRILELYLNSIEYGQSLYGIKKASSFYFQKNPTQLNYREGAFIAMLLPSPKKYSQSFKQRKLSDFAFNRINKILQKLVLQKIITQDEKNIYLREPFSWEENQY